MYLYRYACVCLISHAGIIILPVVKKEIIFVTCYYWIVFARSCTNMQIADITRKYVYKNVYKNRGFYNILT